MPEIIQKEQTYTLSYFPNEYREQMFFLESKSRNNRYIDIYQISDRKNSKVDKNARTVIFLFATGGKSGYFVQ
jgi:hypothetical protein